MTALKMMFFTVPVIATNLPLCVVFLTDLTRMSRGARTGSRVRASPQSRQLIESPSGSLCYLSAGSSTSMSPLGSVSDSALELRSNCLTRWCLNRDITARNDKLCCWRFITSYPMIFPNVDEKGVAKTKSRKGYRQANKVMEMKLSSFRRCGYTARRKIQVKPTSFLKGKSLRSGKLPGQPAVVTNVHNCRLPIRTVEVRR